MMALRHDLGADQDVDLPGAAGDEAALGAATGTGLGRWGGEAAMVALQDLVETMLDQPGGAVRTLEAVTAGAAEGQRRVAAAVQEQQRLLAGGQRPAAMSRAW